MALTPDLEKTRKDIEKRISDSASLHAIAGAGDFAVEKIRVARTEITARVEAFDTKTFREQAQARVIAGVGTIQSGVESLQADVKAAPEQAKALPTKAQVVLGDALTTLLSTAVSTYSDLAGRGKTMVTRVRPEAETADVDDQVKTTASKAKAATTTAKKSASATKSSAKKTATTAKKSAAKTKTASKRAATSAKKTASEATKATEAAASKVDG